MEKMAIVNANVVISTLIAILAEQKKQLKL